MKSKRVLRYYCDHCKKSGCGKAAMRTHEEHCTNNPQRKCRMCAKIPDRRFLNYSPLYRETKLSAMVECVRNNPPNVSLELIREMADGCPACILAAIRQGQGPYDLVEFEFNFKKEAENYLSEKHESMEIYK